MNGAIEHFNDVSAAWFGAMKLVTLQSIVVFTLASCAARLLWKAGPAWTFWIWIAAAGKLIILLAFPWIVAIPILTTTVNEHVPLQHNGYIVSYAHSTTADAQIESTTLEPTQYLSWQSGLFSMWSILIACQAVIIVRRRRQLSSTLSRCRQTDKCEEDAVDVLRKTAGVPRSVRVCRGDVAVPFVASAWHPTIVLPIDLAPVQTHENSRRVVLHELAHVRRRDLMWIWIPEIARIIFFFNPIAYCIRTETALAREAACDQFVIQTGTSAVDYANMLLTFSSKGKGKSSHTADTTELLGLSSN